MLVDAFVLLPVVVLHTSLESVSRELAITLVIPMAVAYSAYTICGHGKFGQTVGKYLVGIRVVSKSGDVIDWHSAFVRSSVDIVFAVLGVVASLVALATIPDVEYYGISWMQRVDNLFARRPSWLSWEGTAVQIWIWSEVVVVLFNKDRRALHDFIAGTVVITERKTPHAAVLPASSA